VGFSASRTSSYSKYPSLLSPKMTFTGLFERSGRVETCHYTETNSWNNHDHGDREVF
jgi:hypothetical protein